MPRQILHRIEAVRATRLLKVRRDDKGDLQFESVPSGQLGGYYWIYTDYSLDELEACTPSNLKGAIDIAQLTKLHRDLPNVCSIEKDGFRLVYNGIVGHSPGIRGRLGQHFNGGKGTGALHISKSSLTDLNRWRVSYASVLSTGTNTPDDASDYSHAENVERIWRLQHGWPLLCTR
ncbi:hypothetical protein N5C93_27530 [Pseudomonas nitroreducens]|uniref:GIY-YIG domain-containing protein n=1 Tax=Pseudomonas nitroreducens TaxID=46680 RepID=A0ABS0KMX6_PSENT|nr:hypothetical protein [Pseudomonas nitroreducens]MBG6289444.1 hypothetical protein [Pseudomonas nitroreducens]MDG9857316.1 hypothetical protein [Pseudomonas nitroreducens]MDH1076590.1 hypothetical protein [Pseudomonas nitroreducens]